MNEKGASTDLSKTLLKRFGRIGQKPLRIGVFLAIFSILPFFQSVNYPLAPIDDSWLLKQNGIVQTSDLSVLKRIFFDFDTPTRYQLGAEYLPIRDLSVWIDFQLFGSVYQGHRFSHLFYYMGSVFFLFLLLNRLTSNLKLAFCITLIWAWHPLHTESIAWLSERKGVLAALFSFGSLFYFLKYLEQEKKRILFLSTLFLLFAIWSKALAIATIGFFLLILIYHRKKPDLHRKRNIVSFALLLTLSLLAFFPIVYTGSTLNMVSAYPALSFMQRVFLMFDIHARYLCHVILCGELGVSYDTDISAFRAIFGATTLFAMMIFLAFSLRRKSHPYTKHIGYGLALWLFFLLPVSQFIFPLQNAMADRYLLIPSAGAIVLLCILFFKIRYGSFLLYGFAFVAGFFSYQQSQTWRSDIALYQQSIFSNPNSVRNRLKLSSIHANRNEFSQARSLIHQANKHTKDTSLISKYHARLALKEGKLNEAIAILNDALSDKKADFIRTDLAILLLKQHQNERAYRLSKEAVSIQAFRLENQRTLGIAAIRMGKFAEAKRALNFALRLRTYDKLARFNLAVVLAAQGNFQRAQKQLNVILKRFPDFSPAIRLKTQIQRQPMKSN